MALAAVVILVVAARRGWHRLDAPPGRPDAFAPMGGAALFFAMLAAGLVGAQVGRSLAGIEPPADGEPMSLARQAPVAASAYAAQAVVVLTYALLVARARRPEPDRRLRTWRAVGLGALGLVAWWPLVQTVSFLTAAAAEAFSGESADPVAHQTLRLLQESPRDAWFALTVAMVILVAPVVEEVLYRGVLQQCLRRLGYPPWAAVVLASFIFALMHVAVADPYAVLPLFVLSLGFGWAYERSGRLLAPVAMHALFNLANIALAVA